MPDHSSDILDCVATQTLLPVSIEVLGNDAKLNDLFFAKVLWKSLPVLFTSKPDEPSLIAAHDDLGVGSAYESSSFGVHLRRDSRIHFKNSNIHSMIIKRSYGVK